jgi:hypothetical protein
LEVASTTDARTAIAVIPQHADAALVAALQRTSTCVWQHGWGHHFHSAGEFGEGRPLFELVQDAVQGQRALDRLFKPEGWQKIFVPPNHLLCGAFKESLREIGYVGLSGGISNLPPREGLAEQNAEVDLFDWAHKELFSERETSELLLKQLQKRRVGECNGIAPIGLLTHHLVFDNDAWSMIRRLLAMLRSHAAVEFVDADCGFADILERPVLNRTEITTDSLRAPRDVSVVLTSCGRPELLSRTLDSFFAQNNYPVREFIIVEDGPSDSTLKDEPRFRTRNIKWINTGSRVGQIVAIDFAYQQARSEFIFHCEDDWEFFSPNFIEKSLAVLEADTDVVQVWLRSLEDTNCHPVDDEVLSAGNVQYRLLKSEFASQEWGVWHGFCFNPGLRRRREYLLLGSFARLDPSSSKKAFEIERDASRFFKDFGYRAAILVENQGLGFVRHLGWEHTVAFEIPVRPAAISTQADCSASDLKPLFDAPWYVQTYPGLTEENAIDDYLQHPDRDPNPLFDSKWYFARNPTLAGTQTRALAHYLRVGASSGRDPSPFFETDWYLAQNPDVARAGVNALQHFLQFGIAEGRSPNRHFDREWYAQAFASDIVGQVSPLAHYVYVGARSNFPPNLDRLVGSRMLRLYELYPSLSEVEQVSSDIEKRRFVLAYIPENSVGAELGVFTGRFSCEILRTGKPRRLFLVDPWWRAYGDFYPDWGGYTANGRLPTQAAYEAVRARCMLPASRTDVHILIESSQDWLSSLDDEELDWVYLDSTHQYQDTLNELALLSKKIKRSGIIIGDDWFPDPKHIHHGVFKAVHEFLRSSDFSLIFANRQWMLQRVE